jgi:amino acid permease
MSEAFPRPWIVLINPAIAHGYGETEFFISSSDISFSFAMP